MGDAKKKGKPNQIWFSLLFYLLRSLVNIKIFFRDYILTANLSFGISTNIQNDRHDDKES